MELSKRLQAIANNIPIGSVVADVGTDHGHLSIYLALNNISKKIIAMDINRGPLKKAKNNISKYNLNHIIECRLSDGLENLYPGEEDLIVIAGMGGDLISSILKAHRRKVQKSNRLVLSPQSDIEYVRRTIHELGYRIIFEDMIIDSNKYYNILVAEAGIEKYKKDSDYKYGKYLIDNGNLILKDYLLKQLNKLNILSEELERKASIKLKDRLEEIKKEKVEIKEVVDCL